MLNLAGEIEDSLANGPGMRYVLFTQGCNHHCLGCQNQHTWEFKDNLLLDVDDVFEKIKNMPFITGVTFSGGEPFCQAEDLYLLGKRIKEELSLNIMIYTGYTYEELIQQSCLCSMEMTYRLRLLEITDILIDGKFEIDNQENSHKYAGSANQRVLYLKGGEIVVS